MTRLNRPRPKLGFLYLDHVMRFFDYSNFKGWPDKIEQVTYHWGKDKNRFIAEVKRKKIDVLIGNIPATAYETFREIARELPNVRFIPSLDSQFCNKSKENVTHFCEKYRLAAPKTHIFYEPEKAFSFLKKTTYPKIIKRSYGPSNYGGYFVHKVDNESEAKTLLQTKQYFPAYIQDFIPMVADIRVMVIGHQPVCAFWRRPTDGGWLTNTSQGGSMDYAAVPDEALQLAVDSSKAAKAEYWACDIAVSHDDQYRILECATAFAAFPYIRDWIGQYIMWLLAPDMFKKPNILHRNWEELGKLSSNVLRVMRHIAFGQPSYSTDTGEFSPRQAYPLNLVSPLNKEEWPSEIWNFQDLHTKQYYQHHLERCERGSEEAEIAKFNEEILSENRPTEEEWLDFFKSVKGIGAKLATNIVNELDSETIWYALNHDPQRLMSVPNIKARKLTHILEQWEQSPIRSICV